MMDDTLDRRNFLAAAATAILAAPVLGESSETGEGPPVRVAVVGAGGRGSELIRKLAGLREAKLEALCDDYEPHLKYGARYAGEGVAAYRNYGKMLAEVRPEAVVIAVPLHLHHTFAVQALDAGAHVYCEKTMCYSLEEAADLARQVKERGAVFQVGLQRRANPIYEQAAAMVKSGMIGRVTAVKCQWNRNNAWRRSLPVESSHPGWEALDRRLNWRLYRAYSHGLFTELASHQMDVVNRILGTPPKQVWATGGVDYWRDGREAEDNIFCTYDYALPDEDGGTRTVRATCSAILSNAWEGASELILGDKGSLLITQNQCLFYREGEAAPPPARSDGADMITSGATLNVSIDPWANRGKPTEILIEGDDTWGALKAFLQSVQRRDIETVCPASVGQENTATVLMAYQSMREARVVTYPL